VLGIFGVVYRSVLARKLEIGVRRALGSNNFEAIAIFLKQGSVYIVVGAVIGGGLTALGSLLLTSIFTDILDYLPIMLVMSLVCIGSLVLLASYLPARKIVIMEPGDAFRYE
jgi:ABC-type lipoprotein release transport system permease subunit